MAVIRWFVCKSLSNWTGYSVIVTCTWKSGIFRGQPVSLRGSNPDYSRCSASRVKDRQVSMAKHLHLALPLMTACRVGLGGHVALWVTGRRQQDGRLQQCNVVSAGGDELFQSSQLGLSQLNPLTSLHSWVTGVKFSKPTQGNNKETSTIQTQTNAVTTQRFLDLKLA